MASLHLGNAGRLATLAVVVVSISATPIATGAPSTAPPATDNPDSEPLLMQHARIGHTATTMPDGSVLVIGGNDRRGPIALAESFDPVSRRFHPAGSLELARSGHTATLLADGRVLVIGGASSSAEPQGTRSVEVYDPATESFSPAGTLEKARSGHTAALLADGRVLVTGGRRKGGGTRPRGSAELFDPTSGTSVAVGKMQMQRAWHSATPLVDGG